MKKIVAKGLLVIVEAGIEVLAELIKQGRTRNGHSLKELSESLYQSVDKRLQRVHMGHGHPDEIG